MRQTVSDSGQRLGLRRKEQPVDLPRKSEALLLEIRQTAVIKLKQREFRVEFKRQAVCTLTTSGQTISFVASDLGPGKSTLYGWRHTIAEYDLLFGRDDEMSLELARLSKSLFKVS